MLGHWGEMLLFWMDRADRLSGIARDLERRVSDYITTNIHITSSGMLQERLLHTEHSVMHGRCHCGSAFESRPYRRRWARRADE
jgi:predicted TIM-barrel fold metal-dependent hydrolase